MGIDPSSQVQCPHDLLLPTLAPVRGLTSQAFRDFLNSASSVIISLFHLIPFKVFGNEWISLGQRTVWGNSHTVSTNAIQK